MARYSFYLDENVPQEKNLIDYLEPIGNKKGNAIKYLLVQGLAVNNTVLSLSVAKDYEVDQEEVKKVKTLSQDNEDLDSDEIDIDI